MLKIGKKKYFVGVTLWADQGGKEHFIQERYNNTYLRGAVIRRHFKNWQKILNG